MGFLRRYRINDLSMIKIYHQKYGDFKTIGECIQVRDELNICKIKFTDRNGKEQKYWFHFFTGSVVTLPRKNEKWAKDVDPDSEKAYHLSSEPIMSWELDPTTDILYKEHLKKENREEHIDEESLKNVSINKIN